MRKVGRLFALQAMFCAMTLAACSSSTLIDYRSKELEGDIKVEKSTVELREDGLAVARVVLLNESSDNKRVEYKFIWLDAEGIPLDEIDHPWHPLSLKTGDHKTVSGIAPHGRARRFQIQIRVPR